MITKTATYFLMKHAGAAQTVVKDVVNAAKKNAGKVVKDVDVSKLSREDLGKVLTDENARLDFSNVAGEMPNHSAVAREQAEVAKNMIEHPDTGTSPAIYAGIAAAVGAPIGAGIYAYKNIFRRGKKGD